jgi:hypothetical protein
MRGYSPIIGVSVSVVAGMRMLDAIAVPRGYLDMARAWGVAAAPVASSRLDRKAVSKELRAQLACALEPVSVHPNCAGAINVFCGIVDK